jgi:hypothetical protein
MNKSNWFWPDVSDLEEAKKACRVAMWCAIVVAGVTCLFAGLAMAGTKLTPVNGSAFLDAAIFAGIAFGLSRYSRIAGVAGFVLFLIERIYMISQTRSAFGGGLFLGIVLLIAFMNGMRGAFAYQKLHTQAGVPLASPPFS